MQMPITHFAQYKKHQSHQKNLFSSPLCRTVPGMVNAPTRTLLAKCHNKLLSMLSNGKCCYTNIVSKMSQQTIVDVLKTSSITKSKKVNNFVVDEER
jgi:hypothetical protein